ncbi:MAG: ankyrin repeat domain-containing protein [Alphaproteobacteria bacterium]|nr:ankyrin repeat domain-containing protein [Alphaproteobacteria bacterium]
MPDDKNNGLKAELNKRLFEAAGEGSADEVGELLEQGAEVDRRDTGGWAALHFATQHDNPKTALVLIRHGAAIDIRENGVGDTPLHHAAMRGKDRVASALLDHGADVNAVNAFNATPLHEAAVGGHAALVKALIARGADVNARDGQGRTPLERAEEQGESAAAEVICEEISLRHGQRVKAVKVLRDRKRKRGDRE